MILRRLDSKNNTHTQKINMRLLINLTVSCLTLSSVAMANHGGGNYNGNQEKNSNHCKIEDLNALSNINENSNFAKWSCTSKKVCSLLCLDPETGKYAGRLKKAARCKKNSGW